MRKILSVWLLCCGVASLAFAQDKEPPQPVCGTPETITKSLKDLFGEVPVISWATDRNSMYIMYYNARTKSVTFAKAISFEEKITVCVISAGVVMGMSIDDMKEHEDL
jgi:hypothetical protein